MVLCVAKYNVIFCYGGFIFKRLQLSAIDVSCRALLRLGLSTCKYAASHKIEYQWYLYGGEDLNLVQYVGLTAVPHSCADSLEFLGAF